jgi:hypothetical protein
MKTVPEVPVRYSTQSVLIRGEFSNRDSAFLGCSKSLKFWNTRDNPDCPEGLLIMQGERRIDTGRASAGDVTSGQRYGNENQRCQRGRSDIRWLYPVEQVCQ